jgi:hypothetical protein
MPPATKQICAGSTMRVRRTVSAWTSGGKSNCQATSGSAKANSSAVSATASTVIVPSAVAVKRLAASAPRCLRMRS